MKFVSKGLIDNKSALVRVMAWRRTDDKPLSEPLLNQFTDACRCHLGKLSFDDDVINKKTHTVGIWYAMYCIKKYIVDGKYLSACACPNTLSPLTWKKNVISNYWYISYFGMWRRHDIETLSSTVGLCARYISLTWYFSSLITKGQQYEAMMLSSVFAWTICCNKLYSGRWFQTPWCSCDINLMNGSGVIADL